MKKDLTAVQEVFQALADPTRLRIVGLLRGGEVCVCHIHETLRIPQSKASRHLAYLRRTGIVVGEKRGLWVYYRLAERRDEVSRALVTTVRHCLSHLDVVQRDSAKLEKDTGCCMPATEASALGCCSGSLGRR